MQTLHKLSNFNLKNLDGLVFKKLAKDLITKLKGELLDEVSPFDVFGTNLEGLELIEDLGYKVPKCLALLRKCIYDYNGFEREGIFRLAGEEGKMLQMKKDLNMKRFQGSDDVFGVASLIKRWFGELPVRIFENVSLKIVTAAVECNEDAIILLETIAELQ